MPEMTALSVHIQKARHAMNETQLEFAEHCGICVKTLSDIELAIANPTLKVIQRIAAYIGVPAAEMLRIEPEEKAGDDE